MNAPNILILDYSVDRLETENIKACLPANARVASLFIDTEDSFPDDLIEKDYTHIIHTGSALSINRTVPFTKKAHAYIRRMRDRGAAQMGICYGHQLVCQALGGAQAVRRSPNGFEAGWCEVAFSRTGMDLLGVREIETVWQHHFDEVVALPDGSEILATSQHTKVQAYVNRAQRLLGSQFHPEFDRERGNAYFRNDREFVESNGYRVDEIIRQGPSFDTGLVFFGFFLTQI